jgi:hypothetical protein
MKKSLLQKIVKEEVQAVLKEQSNPELDRMVQQFVKGLATKNGYGPADAVYAIFEAMARLKYISNVPEDIIKLDAMAEGTLKEASFTSQMNPDTLELYREYTQKIDIFDRNAINNHQVLDSVMAKDPRVQKNNQKRLLQQALGWAITFAQEMER